MSGEPKVTESDQIITGCVPFGANKTHFGLTSYILLMASPLDVRELQPSPKNPNFKTTHNNVRKETVPVIFFDCKDALEIIRNP